MTHLEHNLPFLTSQLLQRGCVGTLTSGIVQSAEAESCDVWLGHTVCPLLRHKGVVINYGEGGGATKWENHGSETFRTPILKSENFLHPSFNMAKTSSHRVKTTPKVVVPLPPPPFSMAKTVSAPSPPFYRD